jgi:hypothetical protein
MDELKSDTPAQDVRTYASRQPPIEDRVLQIARIPFWICMISLSSLLILIFLPYILTALIPGRDFLLFYVPPDASLMARFFLSYAIHLILFLVTIISAFIGYKITTASGANPVQVIAPQDYELLAPLVAEGKSDSIAEYVRLSSLTGFTGTFTQLGLTGLPLATIFLTLLFSALTLWDSANFLDLTKLTLGAFIGSFVQRQVERKSEVNSDQSKTPDASR